MERVHRVRRWQALAIAALIVSSGVVAVPQSASAGDTTTYCRGLYDPPPCTTTVDSYSNVRIIMKSVHSLGQHRYTVRQPGGKLLRRGTIVPNRNAVFCYFGKYRGRVKVSIQVISGVPLHVSIGY